ncbi:hypothetical protein PPOP_3864, partial [Paenibacillus popilliae ATCC 14706]
MLNFAAKSTEAPANPPKLKKESVPS